MPGGRSMTTTWMSFEREIEESLQSDYKMGPRRRNFEEKKKRAEATARRMIESNKHPGRMTEEQRKLLPKPDLTGATERGEAPTSLC